jgi:Arc/MetJ family transcription regulator
MPGARHGRSRAFRSYQSMAALARVVTPRCYWACRQHGAIMSLTTLDLDDEALAQTMKLAGATTKKEAVNTALREFAARHRRIASLERFADLGAGWDHESWERAHAAEKGA